MQILNCVPGPVSLDLMFMDPIDDTGFVIGDAVIQVLFALEIDDNGQIIMVGCSIFFEKRLKLYAPDLKLLNGLLIGKAECLSAEIIDDFLAEATIGAHAILGVNGPVQLLVPDPGLLPDSRSL